MENGEPRVKVEVLYLSECPSYPAAVKLVREVLAAQSLATDIHEVLVRDERMASELKFLGSPTIRINGRDVTGEDHKLESYALSCRLYPGSKQIGLPPEETIRLAILEAQPGEPR